jgi:FKBP-type peptidyl-prolyl cis-trans isomerase (trigger factor)
MKKIIKRAIKKWDDKNISSLIEKDIESLADYIEKELRKK